MAQNIMELSEQSVELFRRHCNAMADYMQGILDTNPE